MTLPSAASPAAAADEFDTIRRRFEGQKPLIELDERINLWRIRHYKVVARVIGDSVVGTQGTPVEVLGRLVHHVFRPDGKSQGTVEYENDRPKRIETVVVSTQHAESAKYKQIKDAVMELVQAAAETSQQTISHSLVRLLSKLAALIQLQMGGRRRRRNAMK